MISPMLLSNLQMSLEIIHMSKFHTEKLSQVIYSLFLFN